MAWSSASLLPASKRGGALPLIFFWNLGRFSYSNQSANPVSASFLANKHPPIEVSMAQRDIVVVGASAGGIAALEEFVAAFPEGLQVSVFVVLHIPPDASSKLAEILARRSALPVVSAIDGAAILPGHIYVAVPDRHLLVEQDRVRVTRGPKENRARPAVDVLFRSAAYHYGPRVIGIVFSGNLDDGTAGLWTIKDRGGVAVVQLPSEALWPSMPESAIAHVNVDHILPVAEMQQVIASSRIDGNMGKASPPTEETMEAEINIAEGGNALGGGTLDMGKISPNTCPACHGVLVRIEEGSIVRYRCHTGHAFSVQSLYAQVSEEIDDSLIAVLRVINERILLLQELVQQARHRQENVQADNYAQQLGASQQWAAQLRDMLAGTDRGLDLLVGGAL
jgi:two-component system chemotaxis response regulator CheB